MSNELTRKERDEFILRLTALRSGDRLPERPAIVRVIQSKRVSSERLGPSGWRTIYENIGVAKNGSVWRFESSTESYELDGPIFMGDLENFVFFADDEQAALRILEEAGGIS